MPNLQFNSLTKVCFLGLIGCSIMLSFSACSPKINFLTSSVVPAARGTVTVKTDDNKNHKISIEIINLAEPERLQPPKKMYMVWMTTDQDITKNLGQIKTSSGKLSSTLKASFETVTTFKPVKIFITAEEDSNVQSPGWEIVLSTDKFSN